ncbi:hypothetical protein ACS0TY_016968 [Phlomoides rotata]
MLAPRPWWRRRRRGEKDVSPQRWRLTRSEGEQRRRLLAEEGKETVHQSQKILVHKKLSIRINFVGKK